MLPLDGIKVVDLTRFQMGPFATVLLSDLGAEVIKVEDPGVGDPGRGVAAPRTRVNPYFLAHNRNKRSITVDARKEEGKEIIYKLVASADVFVQNFRPGVADRLKLDYETLCRYNPRLIYASASGFGLKGPKREKPALDIAAQAMGGMMSVTGLEGTIPQPAGTAIADQTGAIFLAYGIMTALFVRERTGLGQEVDVSLFGSQLALQSWEITQSILTGVLPKRAGRGHQLIRSTWSAYPAADGHLALAGVGPDKWPAFCKMLGIEEILSDPRFDTPVKRIENRDELFEVLDSAFPKKTRAEWLSQLEQLDVICAPVYNYHEAASDPQAIENEYITTISDAEHGEVKVVGLPVKFSKTPGKPRSLPPLLGEHNEEILKDLGYRDEQIEELKQKKVI